MAIQRQTAGWLLPKIFDRVVKDAVSWLIWWANLSRSSLMKSSGKEVSMAYAIVVWASVSVGFVMGAVWSRLGEKNKQYDRKHDYNLKESYSGTQGGEL